MPVAPEREEDNLECETHSFSLCSNLLPTAVLFRDGTRTQTPPKNFNNLNSDASKLRGAGNQKPESSRRLGAEDEVAGAGERECVRTELCLKKDVW